MHPDLRPDLLLAAYASGLFPMSDENGEVYWFSPDPRAIIELDTFHVSRSLRKVYQRRVFEVAVDRDFAGVIEACAEREEGTWISPDIIDAYSRLHAMGVAHSVEAWCEGQLAGGLYGVALGGAFFGESMFYQQTDASKVALVHLVERMRSRGYELLDVQFTTGHLRRFGCIEIPRSVYLARLEKALKLQCSLAD
jgi:leucyl/phenylalanyl-tRNA--protein transferase